MRARATSGCNSARSPRPILGVAIGSYPFFDSLHGANTNAVLRARDTQKLAQAKRASRTCWSECGEHNQRGRELRPLTAHARSSISSSSTRRPRRRARVADDPHNQALPSSPIGATIPQELLPCAANQRAWCSRITATASAALSTQHGICISWELASSNPGRNIFALAHSTRPLHIGPAKISGVSWR